MKVGRQEQICVKLDRTSAKMLYTMAQESGAKKNRIINEAIWQYYMSSEWKSHNHG